MKKVAVLIDGGYLRVLVRKQKHKYTPKYIEKVALACADGSEAIFRVLYYDCAQYSGTVKLPVSGADRVFKADNAWLRELAQKDLFAVRQGVLKFRGYKPKKIPVAPAALTDNDFKPDFEQKGVDMRIGLDIAVYSTTLAVDRVVLLSGDTDCIPAMKHGRKAGLQMVMIRMAGERIAHELAAHADYVRDVAWPVP